MAKPRLNHERLTESGTFGYGNLIENLASRGNLKDSHPRHACPRRPADSTSFPEQYCAAHPGVGEIQLKKKGARGRAGSKDQAPHRHPVKNLGRSGAPLAAWRPLRGTGAPGLSVFVGLWRHASHAGASCSKPVSNLTIRTDQEFDRPPVAPLPHGHGTDRKL